jgi:hypothetical protein
MIDQSSGPIAFPPGYDLEAVAEVYGDPAKYLRPGVDLVDRRFPDANEVDDGRWRAAILSPIPVVFPGAVHLGSSQALAKQVYCHRLVRASLVDVFTELSDRNLWRHVQDFEGCYAYRAIRGSDEISFHSWGIALDLNSRRYPLGSLPDPTDPWVTQVVPVFRSHGWAWGGDYKGRKDPMHVEAVAR